MEQLTEDQLLQLSLMEPHSIFKIEQELETIELEAIKFHVCLSCALYDIECEIQLLINEISIVDLACMCNRESKDRIQYRIV